MQRHPYKDFMLRSSLFGGSTETDLGVLLDCKTSMSLQCDRTIGNLRQALDALQIYFL